MRVLRLVGPDEDGTSLIVEAVETGSVDSERGERFTLSLDERLRTMATTRPDRQPEAASDAPAASSGPVPTPREIQVRVRAGETAQAVADEAGIPLERVMRFAYPVLQERVRVTDEARRARARRGGDGLLVPFGELIDSRLARHGLDSASVRWDAYRREDGGWTVTSAFSAHEREVLAKFSFALANRTVSALDDIAADLLSDRPVQALLAPPAPVVEPAGSEWDAAPGPRLTAVPNPSRTDVPRPQETGAAVRPPSRRQKAHTRPVPITVDDELFDQDAFDQQPWHEPPLPFEVGGAGRGGAPSTAAPSTAAPSTAAPSTAAPRHRAQRPAGGGVDAVRPAQPEAVERTVAELTERPAPRVSDSGQTDLEGLFAAGSRASGFDADVEDAPAPTAGSAPTVDAAGTAEPITAEPETSAAPITPAPETAAPVSAVDPQGKRGRRAGEKPRMPSWDDILLGVRHKSD